MKFGDRYGRLDRVLHDIAFRAGQAQRALADIEEMVYRDRLAGISPADPVFVTALPRSGTSILLRLLAESGHFASHTYRDMPFVLCPMLWGRFSRRFAVEDRATERAHGDGLTVSPDTPEAFEEMIWKEFWPDHYGPDRIRPWQRGEEDREFSDFFTSHMRKVIALRREDPGDRRRYLSKNNLNIARLAARPGPLAEGTFLIPVRDPVQQAASMLRQHRRFLELHEEDDFVRRYMEAIGHHEFGKGLKPVDFGGWAARAPDPRTLDFWLRYWVEAYRHIRSSAGDGATLVSYARLTGEPEAALGRLADVLDIPSTSLVSRASRLRPPRTHTVDEPALDAAVLEEARTLHRELEERAAV